MQLPMPSKPKHARHQSQESVASTSSSASSSSSSSSSSSTSSGRPNESKRERRQRLALREQKRMITAVSTNYRIISSLDSKGAQTHNRAMTNQFQTVEKSSGKLNSLWICSLKNKTELAELQAHYNGMMTLKNMKHLPNVKRLNYTNNYCILTWDYCSNGNAYNILYNTTNGLNELKIIHILMQCLHPIVYLHDHGHYHGNVNLKNIRFNSKNQVKLNGFVLPKNIDFISKDQLDFLPPEFILNNNTNRGDMNWNRSDVWSLGICFFIMLTRSLNFSNNYYLKLDRNDRKLTPNIDRITNHPKVQVLSKTGKMLIYGLLNVDAEDRLTSRQALNLCKLAHSRLLS